MAYCRNETSVTGGGHKPEPDDLSEGLGLIAQKRSEFIG
jgi:hypothetical protein